ncbi:MAG: STAS domain-containing protein [Acidobacteria bacterium]|nr:STAS domain-containing protein [Acidobacteriota bacterium]
MNFFVKSYESDGAQILILGGKLTIGAPVRELRQAIDARLASQSKCIILNFSQLMFMDSSGIGELVGCNNKVKAAGGTLLLCELPNKVRDLFRITHVAKLFSIHESESAAIESFLVGETKSATSDIR